MNRRQFVFGAAVTGDVLSKAWTASTRPAKEKLKHVSISTWSFHDLFTATRGSKFAAA
jgi:hypothetical protein